MSYRDTYEAWLASPALTAEEKAELEAIQNDEKEIESRFFSSWSSAPPVCGAPCASASTT